MRTQVFQACEEVSVQLERTALARMHAMQDFAIKCYMEIFHPVQNARGQLEAFPHIIDTMALANLLRAPPSAPLLSPVALHLQCHCRQITRNAMRMSPSPSSSLSLTKLLDKAIRRAPFSLKVSPRQCPDR